MSEQPCLESDTGDGVEWDPRQKCINHAFHEGEQPEDGPVSHAPLDGAEVGLAFNKLICGVRGVSEASNGAIKVNCKVLEVDDILNEASSDVEKQHETDEQGDSHQACSNNRRYTEVGCNGNNRADGTELLVDGLNFLG